MGSVKKHAVIIGAGPAGLTAGIELLKTGNWTVSVVERDSVVGGLARTTEYKGCRFDIGPHHFITDSPAIERWWKDLMKDDFFAHQRFTRIYYKKHFFKYPLEPLNVIKGLSLWECIRCIANYINIRLAPIKPVKSFQDWVTNKFGARLFNIFFKTYTEKVWGIPCHKISADWASQRIKGFSLSKAIFYAFFGRFFKKNAPRTISDIFYYPSRGAGTLWEKAADLVRGIDGGNVFLHEEVIALIHDGKMIQEISTRNMLHGSKDKSVQKLNTYKADHFFSTMSLRALIQAMHPLPPAEVIAAAQALQYRGLITVNLIIDKINVCPDHWLYVHEKEVKMGRIGNMNNFSLKMVDAPHHSAISLEYFEFVESAFWQKSEQELIELGKKELAMIGLVQEHEVLDGMVIKTAEAYPVYDEHYQVHLSTVLDYLKNFSNLHLMGRNGLHRYNNMDIAMLSAIAAVEKVKTEILNEPLAPLHSACNTPPSGRAA